MAGLGGSPFTLLSLDGGERVWRSVTLKETSVYRGWDRVDYDDSRIYLRLTTDSNAIDGGDRWAYISVPRSKAAASPKAISSHSMNSADSALAISLGSDKEAALFISDALIKRWCQGIDNMGCVCWDDGAESGIICPDGDDGGGGGGSDGGGGGGDSEPDGGGTNPGAGSVPLSPEQMQKLNAAKNRAKQRLEDLQQCGDLFKDLTLTNGPGVIDATTYRSHPNSDACGAGAAIWTQVGSLNAYLCNSFINQVADMRAALVIHEAMHSAGQRESPQYPGYPTSVQLTNLVRTTCNL